MIGKAGNCASVVWMRASQILGLLRLEPFDCSTEAGRWKERHRRIALTALASFVARAVNVLTVLVSVPMTVHYLGEERYGL